MSDIYSIGNFNFEIVALGQIASETFLLPFNERRKSGHVGLIEFYFFFSTSEICAKSNFLIK